MAYPTVRKKYLLLLDLIAEAKRAALLLIQVADPAGAVSDWECEQDKLHVYCFLAAPTESASAVLAVVQQSVAAA